jgi:hypothetical protein
MMPPQSEFNEAPSERAPLNSNYGSTTSTPIGTPLSPPHKHSAPTAEVTTFPGCSITSEQQDENSSYYNHSFQQRVLIKTQNSTFLRDAVEFREGSIPHSMVLALTIGSLCGLAAFLYYAFLEILLEYAWKTLPGQIFFDNVPTSLHVLWIPLMGTLMALGVGVTVRFMGEVRLS